MAESPRVRGLDHIAIVVADVDASHDFYVGVLGMEQVARPAFDFGGAWFRAGETLVHAIAPHDRSGPVGINEADAGVEAPSAGATSPTKTSRWTHIAFDVDDVEAFLPTIRAADVPILDGPKRRPDGVTQLFVLDPDGHIIELS